jgi:hypothetical protein
VHRIKGEVPPPIKVVYVCPDGFQGQLSFAVAAHHVLHLPHAAVAVLALGSSQGRAGFIKEGLIVLDAWRYKE